MRSNRLGRCSITWNRRCQNSIWNVRRIDGPFNNFVGRERWHRRLDTKLGFVGARWKRMLAVEWQCGKYHQITRNASRRSYHDVAVIVSAAGIEDELSDMDVLPKAPLRIIVGCNALDSHPLRSDIRQVRKLRLMRRRRDAQCRNRIRCAA